MDTLKKRDNILAEIEAQIFRFSQNLAKLKKLSRSFSLYRLLILVTGLIAFLFLFFFTSGLAAYISSLLFISVFAILVKRHNNIDFAIKKNEIWISLKKENASRIKIDWKNIPLQDEVVSNDNHPFESDLNITGRFSLLHLINLSTSKEGTELLHNWLVNTNPEYETIVKRQEIIRELVPLIRFREKLQLNSKLSSKKLFNGNLLFELLKESPGTKIYKKILRALYILIPVNITFFILYLSIGIPAYFTIGLLIQLGIYWFNARHISELFDKAISFEEELGRFSRILEFLERYPYPGRSNLKVICEPFISAGIKPSKRFRQIKGSILAFSIQKNPVTSLIFNIIFPWDFYHASRFERLKKEISVQLPQWLDTWYNLEALGSLANLAYINPQYTFPGLVTGDEKIIFQADNISHPLIPFEKNVTNNFKLNKIGECIIITGSNMSGKSTFLKTVGLNLSLAYAGGPVFASNLQTRIFRIYTCIKVSDSVTDGISYFYAEVKRLKSLLNELKKEDPLPLFYLIDEIFRGTNNLERLIGSRSFIKALAGSKGTGLISTHDLELVKLENEIPDIFNYHFKEEVLEDKMIFDYMLRRGPCPTTNALKIMKLEGLPVEQTDKI